MNRTFAEDEGFTGKNKKQIKIPMNILPLLSIFLLFQQDGITSTNEGVPYTPNEGIGGWLLAIVGLITVAIVAFVVFRVFKGIQRSRALEREEEDMHSPRK